MDAELDPLSGELSTYQPTGQEDSGPNVQASNSVNVVEIKPEVIITKSKKDKHQKKRKNEVAEVEIPKKRKRFRYGDPNFEEGENKIGFPLYCCSACDSKFMKLEDLQRHVTEHKNRLTSWDLKVRNQKKKVLKRKLIKHLKKKVKTEAGIIKVEDIKVEVEDVPEEQANIDYSTPNYDPSNLLNSETLKDTKHFLYNIINQSMAHLNDSSTNDSTPNNNETKTNECGTSTDEVAAKNAGTSHNSTHTGPLLKEGCNSENQKVDIPEVNANVSADTIEPKTKEAGTDTRDMLVPGIMDKEIIPLKYQLEPIDPNLEKIFKCGICAKQFTLSYYLKLHLRSHTGEKPYQCHDCGLSFITASKLSRHRKRTHLSIRFECRICHRPFTRFEFLTRHFRKHHAEDIIEGEPYDFNAILPYLKELETEIEQKRIEDDKKKKEEESKMDICLFYPQEDQKPSKEDLEWDMPLHMIKEEYTPVKAEDVKVEVKEDDTADDQYADAAEASYEPPQPALADEARSHSEDDDYFPQNTWLPPTSTSGEDAKKIRSRTAPLSAKNKTESSDPLFCDICQKKIKSITYMRVHMRTHTGDRPYKCAICGKGFITASKMNRHVLTHEDWERCLVAEKKEGEPTIKQEKASDDDENDPTKPKTKKPLKKRRKKLLTTIKREPGDDTSPLQTRKRPFSCEYCNKKFAYLEAMEIHKATRHAGEKRVFMCNYCLEKFEDEVLLKVHESAHGGPRPYVCTVCNKTYKKKETMIYHKRAHSLSNAFQCDVCPKSFNAACKLQRHIMSHRADKFVVRYECPVCAHIFNTKYHVEMHLATHEKEGVILQENRGQVLAMVLQNARKIPLEADTPSTLTNLIPTDERSRICNICGEIFNHFFYLEQHLKTHGSKFSIESNDTVEERKHICPVCNKGFKLSYYLKLHSFTHTKEKPFICQQCGKGFITKGKLKRHLETHAGLKKYQCHVCCKFFTRPSYLRIHVRTIHGNQDYNFKMDRDYEMGIPLGGSCMSMLSQDSV